MIKTADKKEMFDPNKVVMVIALLEPADCLNNKESKILPHLPLMQSNSSEQVTSCVRDLPRFEIFLIDFGQIRISLVPGVK